MYIFRQYPLFEAKLYEGRKENDGRLYYNTTSYDVLDNVLVFKFSVRAVLSVVSLTYL